MKHSKCLLAALALLIAAHFPSAAPAQQFNTIPDHSVVGRMGTGSGSGPSQAVPFATLFTFLPASGQASLGGVKSSTCSSHNWFNTLSTGGVLGCAQPSFADLSSSLACSQTPAQTGDVTTSAGSCATTIANSAVTNAKMANMNAYTIKGNATGSGAAPTDISIPALTQKASPVAGDYVMIADSAASNQLKYVLVSALASAGSVGSVNGQTGSLAIVIAPQGRLTLTSATPVLTSTVSGATTVYYTPYRGNQVPIYDGTNIVPTAFAEVSQATTDTTKSPAAVTTNSNYDVFCWIDSGPTNRCTHGPAWSSDTSRGTGAGTTELVRVNGLLLNANSITNGPAAQRGTYVGTIRSNGSSTIDYIFGTAAGGGGAGFFGVWNAYNRHFVSTMVRDTADTWTYSTAITWRAADNSSTARVSFVRGLDEDAIAAQYNASGIAGASTSMAAGIGLDSTTAFSGTTWLNNVPSTTAGGSARYSGIPGLGFHYVSALEYNSTTTVSTWQGDLGLVYFQTGLHVELWN